MVRFFRNNKGFTLIELLIVMVIIAVLATLGLVSYQNAMRNARDSRRKSDIKALSAAAEQYYTANNGTHVTAGSQVNSYFPNNTRPQDPQGGDYPWTFPSASDYCVCADLEGTTGNSTASCGGTGTGYFCLQEQQ